MLLVERPRSLSENVTNTVVSVMQPASLVRSVAGPTPDAVRFLSCLACLGVSINAFPVPGLAISALSGACFAMPSHCS